MKRNLTLLLLLFCFLIFLSNPLFAGEVLSPNDLLNLKEVAEARISPDGQWIAYTVRVPRQAGDKPGSAYSELYLVSVATGKTLPFITGKGSIKSLAWKPDGSTVGFLSNRENGKTQVWAIPLSGGEAQQLTDSETSVTDFAWHPSGNEIGYLATTPQTARDKALEDKGYGFVFYEENLRPRNFYMLDLDEKGAAGRSEQITKDVTVWTFEFSPDGKTAAATISPKNLIDHNYMFRKIHLLDLVSKADRQLVDTPGKLGNMAFSPDGTYLAFAGALERKDNQVSQAFVIPVSGGEAKNLTPPNFRGHVNWVGWKYKNTVLYRAYEGTATTLSTVAVGGGKRQLILNSQESGIVFDSPSYTADFKHFAFVGQSPTIPADVFYWQPGKSMKRMSEVNPWLAERELGKQEVIHYKARDGWEIEGLLIYPVNYQKGERCPLVVIVHGGPEHNYSNEWVSRYSEPGQVLAGRGYAVFYPNYRASTGYGVDFALQGLGNPAGKEFDDIADGIDYLVAQGIADRNRVGLGGGSYGGYAAAWFATYYTQYVKAVCMFVGISDLISKRGTTDIPYEDLYVHSGKKLEDAWDLSLKRSPIYWAHQSKTAILIIGGADDTRVHPSQSLELYRRLKMNDHPAARLVQYPGEKHGNSKQPGRIDVLYRVLDWYDWYVKDAKPLNGPMPPLDISDKYGLDLPK